MSEKNEGDKSLRVEAWMCKKASCPLSSDVPRSGDRKGSGNSYVVSSDDKHTSYSAEANLADDAEPKIFGQLLTGMREWTQS